MNMRKNLQKLSVVSITAVSLSLLFTTATFAIGTSNRPANTGSGSAAQNTTHQPSARPSLPSQATARLEGAKLQACQARENATKTRSKRLTRLATTMQEKFDAIAKRVEDYYTTKVVPSGKTVSNYDSLVADIQTKKNAVQTALTNAQSDLSGFSCTDNNPKAMITKFNEDMKAVKSALREYRMSVKNLIVGVHSVTGQENRTNPSNKPSQNPGQGNTNRGGNQ